MRERSVGGAGRGRASGSACRRARSGSIPLTSTMSASSICSSATRVFRDLIQHPTAIEFVTALLGPGFPDLQLHRQHRAPRRQIDGAAFRPGHRRAPSRGSIPGDSQRHLVPERRRRGERRHALRAGQPPAPLGLGAAAGRAGADACPSRRRPDRFAVMDGRLWHTSGANVSQSRERALLFGYYSRLLHPPAAELESPACRPRRSRHCRHSCAPGSAWRRAPTSSWRSGCASTPSPLTRG